MDRHHRYTRLKALTILGPTLFVAGGEILRELFLRRYFPHWTVSGIAVASTLLAAILFSWYMFRTIEVLEADRHRAEEALLSLRERDRIAREMHDGVAQNLSVLKLEAFRLREFAAESPRLAAELEAIDKLINHTYLEVRQSLYDLRASRWLDEGFWVTVERQVAEFERQSGIDVVFRPLDPPLELWSELASAQILRIIQEALSNIRRHSQAHRVVVRGIRQGPMVVFTVHDDGVGFDVRPEFAHHFGLEVMRERAETIGAAFALTSGVGQGTTIELRVPVDQRGGESGKG